MKSTNSTLKQLRHHIDAIDHQLIVLLAKRMNASYTIGQLKKRDNLPVKDRERWRQVKSSRILLGTSLGLPSPLIRILFHHIHIHSLSVQK